ncbi:hypothetical protein CDAR_91771 [Caerostris darwini]|uniref:Uncharacterized protein n=1 Tax=Caerostris darwini TaxID=1538125 RepID=A0AAV4QR15_9ARAC|nr:hypothetical protein CDAR_91771 [Caerostris darwini]
MEDLWPAINKIILDGSPSGFFGVSVASCCPVISTPWAGLQVSAWEHSAQHCPQLEVSLKMVGPTIHVANGASTYLEDPFLCFECTGLQNGTFDKRMSALRKIDVWRPTTAVQVNRHETNAAGLKSIDRV